MHIAEAVRRIDIDTNRASPTSLASDGLELGLERCEKFQTVLASAETPDHPWSLQCGIVGTMGSNKARLSVSTSSGAGAGEAVS